MRCAWIALVAILLAGPAAEAQQRPAAPPAAAPPAAARDAPGGRDHPMVGRYEGSRLTGYLEKAHEAFGIVIRPVLAADVRAENNQRRNARKAMEVAGRAIRIRYEGPAERSALEIVRNHQERLGAQGFETLFFCRGQQCGGNGADLFAAIAEHPMTPTGGHGLSSNWQSGVYLATRLARPEGDVFVTVYTVERAATPGTPMMPTTIVDIVETRPMERNRIVFVDASAMRRAIEQTGRVALYGITFDFDRAEIRPDSRSTLEEIARFLRENPSVALVVAGHTDSQGAFDYNLSLSQRRAAAVVQALTRDFGIPAPRLTPFGAGMAAPVAPNDTEEGRARNRRVELVRR
jgi:outer membrane protein OmpA-like peptidoglycan-associated protein